VQKVFLGIGRGTPGLERSQRSGVKGKRVCDGFKKTAKKDELEKEDRRGQKARQNEVCLGTEKKSFSAKGGGSLILVEKGRRQRGKKKKLSADGARESAKKRGGTSQEEFTKGAEKKRPQPEEVSGVVRGQLNSRESFHWKREGRERTQKKKKRGKKTFGTARRFQSEAVWEREVNSGGQRDLREEELWGRKNSSSRKGKKNSRGKGTSHQKYINPKPQP